MIRNYKPIKIVSCLALFFLLSSAVMGQVYISEIADPNNNSGARFVELHNAGGTPFDLAANNYALLRYTNAGTTPQSPVALTGTIAAGGVYLISNNGTTFSSVYGYSADQSIGTGGPADSNGDDQILLIDNTDELNPITIDIFGVIGEDGSGTDHEFEDGRAERNSNIVTGNTTYTAAEWTIDHDSGGGDGAQDAPRGYDPGTWIGSNALPVVYFTADVSAGTEDAATVVTLTAYTFEAVTGAQTVDVAVTGTDISGTDYSLSAAQITIADATTSGTVTFTIQDDADLENDETAAITISNPSAGIELSQLVTTNVSITDNDGPSIVINEVEYLGTDRIELKNISGGQVDISGYYLCTMAATYTAVNTLGLDFGSLVMDPGDITVLSGFALNDAAADVALYKNNADFSLASNMEFFTQWGSGGNGRESVAVTKGVWSAGDFIPTVSTSGSTIEYSGLGYTSSDWIEQTVSTLGAENSLILTASDIAAARSFGLDAEIRISGEVVISFQGNSADKIYIQDASGGLLIDDNSTINTVYNIGDGITNLAGTLVNGSGVMELVPAVDPGAASSTAQPITALEVTIAAFLASIDTYESRVIKILDVTFDDAGTTFSNFSNFDFTDGSDALTFRPNFSDPDFSATEVPYGSVDVVGIAGEFNGSAQVIPVSAADAFSDEYEPEFDVAPATTNIASGGFDVTFQSNEPGTVFYVVNEIATTLTAAEVFAGSSQAYTNVGADVTINIGGLVQNTQYYVHVALQDDETVPNTQGDASVVTVTATTLNNDVTSDITAGVGETSNIDYAAFQTASTLTDANSVSLFVFDINDKASSDAVSTILAAVSFDITNHENLRTLALFNGATNVGELDVASTIATNTLAFSGLNLEATTGATLSITVRATFMDLVDDQEQIGLTISNATADGAGSSFGASDAGGAASDISTADLNAIAVTATVFEVALPGTVAPATDFTLSAKAVDANGNTDLDARDVTLSKNSGDGTLSSATGLGPVAMTDGIYTWTDVQHDTEDAITVTVTDGAIQTIVDLNVFTTTGGVFFSEYFEGSSNNKYVEIYNNTGASIDLSNYAIKQSNNGAGFDGHADFPAAYSITLSGTLPANEVFIVYNGAAALSEIISAGDLALSYGDNPGDRTISFNGDDALGLFENDILVDLIGDPAIDPGSGWDVAGTTTGTADHTLIRKSSISEGNIVALSSFGTDVSDSEWTVLDQNDVSNIGLHTIDGVASPAMTVTASLTDFGSVDNAASSASQNFTVSGVDLTEDITVTAPTNYSVSLDDVNFSASVILPLAVDLVSTTTVHIKFSPTSGANGVKSGDITISTAGSADETVAVTGTETGNVEQTTGVFITEIADPNNNAGLRYIELYNSTDASVDFTEGTGWRLDKYTNASETVSQTLALTGSIPSKGFYIIATGAEDTDFETAYGVAPDQFDGADNDVAGSNGDDNIELYNGSDILIDQFGVPGEDGTDTDHEFEDGRVERKATVTVGNPTWDLAEWNIDNDGTAFPGNGTRDAPDDFDPTSWIGTGGPLISLDITGFNGSFPAIDVNTISASTSFVVSGSDLTADIVLTAPANFSISRDDASFSSSVTIAQNSGVVGATTIYVQFAPTEAQAYAGSITLTSTDASEKVVALSGTGIGAGTIYYEDFAVCPSSTMTVFSAASDRDWDCTTEGNNGNAAKISGFAADAPNDEWLITPAIDLSAATNAALTFYSWTQYTDATHPTITVMTSVDYIGSGDPTSATWTELSPLWAEQNSETWTSSGDMDLTSLVGNSVFVAFHFTSSGTGSGEVADWAIDDILIEDRASVANPSFTVTGTLADFGSVDNGAVSTSQSFSVEGMDLSADILVTAPASFEVSLDNTTFSSTVDLVGDGGVLAATTVHVRFAPASGSNGEVTGSITVSTTNASDQSVAVSGTEAGNDEIMNDLFFSEYVEPNGGNEKAIEIYNGTGAAVDLSDYMVRVSHNGLGFGNDGDIYDLPLTGSIADKDVYVIYNADATDATILAEGDIAVAFGEANGGSVASFNGDDAIGLFKGGVLIDVIGDPGSDPGAGWDVAGVTEGTVNHTLIRKSTINTGNIVALGSFGTSTGDSEWEVLDENVFSNLGSHTATEPVETGFELSTTNFVGDFGSIAVGEVSSTSSYSVSGGDITGDFTITIPAGFEASLTSDFSNQVGNSTLPLSITPASGEIANVTVFVRFAPTAEGAASGDLVNAAAGYPSINVAVSGTGTAEVTGLDDLAKFSISVYPNPAEEELNINIPDSFGAGELRLVKLDGSEILRAVIGSVNRINTSMLRSGIYLLQISNNETVINHRIVVK
jgi:hypothetical protein